MLSDIRKINTLERDFPKSTNHKHQKDSLARKLANVLDKCYQQSGQCHSQSLCYYISVRMRNMVNQSDIITVSVIAQMTIFMSVEKVQNVHNFQCNRHQQRAMYKVLGENVSICPILDFKGNTGHNTILIEHQLMNIVGLIGWIDLD